VVHAEEWDARRVYNFIVGVGRWGGPVELHAGKEVFLVRDVSSYSHKIIDNMSEDGKADDRNNGGNIETWVHCKVGWVSVRVSVTS
jgi:hypothetical protein